MLDLLLIPLAVLYLLVVSALFVYGMNIIYMSFQAWRKGDSALGEAPQPEIQWPRVTVQLPIYNEMYVAERVINAAAALDYPSHLLEIQVLDDSTDETRSIVRAAVERHRNKGVNMVHRVRSHRQGYKAGALQAGLAASEGEFVAMFDADFLPPPDYLRRILPHFGERTAFVQARWDHLNREHSLLTSLQSLAIDAHFVVEQFARWVTGLWFNFNGTAGVWRRAALDDAGGWRADTLTEDLDMSYRALLRGWKAEYLRNLAVPAELPVSMVAFRRQQHRWARGSLECALKLGGQVWNSSASLWLRISAILHLTGYAVHLLLLALSLLYPAVLMLAQKYPHLITLFGIAYLFNITAFAPTSFFIIGQQQLGRRWWRSLPRILFISAVGSGLMINTARAALQILARKQNVFERTAKFGLGPGKQSWMEKRYQLGLDPIVFWELLLGGLNLASAVLATRQHNWAIALYAGLFSVGLFYVSGLTIVQSVAIYRRQKQYQRNKPVGVPLRLKADSLESGD